MPDSPAALDSLGWVRFRSGDLTGASTTLARAYSLSHDGEIAAHWGEALWVSGNQSEARARCGPQRWRASRTPRRCKATLKRFLPDAK